MAIDLERVVRYPTNSEEWVETLLVGGVLTLFSVLVVPAFLLYGYVLRVLRAGMANADEPPVFDDWGTLLLDGVVATVVLLVYQALPLLVALLTVGTSALALLDGGGVAVGLAGLFVGLSVSTLLALVFGYVGLVGLANYAHTGRAAAAFDTAVLRSVALDRDYAVHWLYGMAALLVAGAIAGLLGVVPIVGAVAGVFVTFYGQVVAAWLWGRGFGAATGIGPATTTGPGPTTDAVAGPDADAAPDPDAESSTEPQP